MPETVSTFDEWIDVFHEWQEQIGFPTNLLGDFKFEAKYSDDVKPEIEFGDFTGQAKWKRPIQIPGQNIRDALLNLTAVQGDTEFASVEQQRHLVWTAPTDYDQKAIMRVMSEEQRHGWQMAHVLSAFGEDGFEEAKKLLERNALEDQRLLGSFNGRIDTWLEFFIFTQFVDRDGKYQLKMLSRSAYRPLAASMGPMLKEEAFHLGTGNNGLKRTLKAGKIPTELIQKYYNRWVPTAHDLFGTDNSTSAEWAYVWGLKGRYDEGETDDPVDKADLNDRGRRQYHAEIVAAQKLLNRNIPDGQPELKVPDLKFNRQIGHFADQYFDIHGNEIESKSDYEAYLKEHLPSKEEHEELLRITEEGGWIVEK